MVAAPRPWWLKAVVQGTLSLLPEPQRWNRLLQRYVTKSIYLRPETFRRKWAQAQAHWDNWSQRRMGPPNVALELGTGWHPLIPIGLSLLGVERIHTVDITSMISMRTLAEVIDAYAAMVDEGAEGVALDPDRVATLEELRARPGSDPHAALARLGIHPVVADARDTGLPSGSVDLFVSNNTLEHVPGPIIEGMFAEFARLASDEALMSHFIDMADHYASFDKRITVYNFLRFSDPAWRLFNNDLQYQNRLRVADFRKLHDATGWRVVDEDNTADAEAFRRVPLAARFRDYTPEDCMVYASWLVAEKGGHA